MSRQSKALLALSVGTFFIVPWAMRAEESPPTKARGAELNQVFVKIIMPIDPADHGKERPVVESWIAEDLKKRGQTTFAAVTGWVPLDLSPFGATDPWRGGQLDNVVYCAVGADIPERIDGRIEVLLVGWTPGGARANALLPDEPGSRVVAPVERCKTPKGKPYVAVIITPPSGNQATPNNAEK